MTSLDMNDGELAAAVLKRLGTKSLREMEREAPVGRGTLHRWQSGDYTMWPKTRRAALEWLGAAPTGSSRDAYAAGVRFAIDKVRVMLDDLEEMARD